MTKLKELKAERDAALAAVITDAYWAAVGNGDGGDAWVANAATEAAEKAYVAANAKYQKELKNDKTYRVES